MPSIASAYRGPLVIIGLGGGFSVVGAVPVAITFSIGVKTSATIIGMGFVGFGFLLIIPGLFWCLMVKTHSFKFWRRRGKMSRRATEETAPTIASQPLNAERSSRPRQWPPVGLDNPPLIISEHSAYDLARTQNDLTVEQPDNDDIIVDASQTNTVASSVINDACTQSPQTIALSSDTNVDTRDSATLGTCVSRDVISVCSTTANTWNIVNEPYSDCNKLLTNISSPDGSHPLRIETKTLGKDELTNLEPFQCEQTTHDVTDDVTNSDVTNDVTNSDVTHGPDVRIDRTINIRGGTPAVLIYEDKRST